LSESKVKGAMKGIGSALDGATSASDLATKGVNVLVDKLSKGLANTGAVAVGKMLGDAMRKLGADLTAAAESASAASKAFNTLDFKSAIASSAQMSATIDKIKASADAIRNSPNPFIQIADYAFGATKNMDELAAATERERQALLGLAAQQDRMSAEAKVGKTPAQRAEIDRLAQNKKELAQAGTISDPATRARAQEDIARRQAAEEQIKEDDRHAKSVAEVGKEAAIQEEKIREAAAKGDAEAKKLVEEFDAKKAAEAKKAQEDADKPQASRVSPGGLMGGGGGSAPAGMSSRDVPRNLNTADQ
jgi:chemotaxis protein histidine kinase CheA